MRNKSWIAGLVSILVVLLFVLASCTHVPAARRSEIVTKQVPAATSPAPPSILAGKTVWIVDVNSNSYYRAVLQPAIVDILPEYAPGVNVRYVETSEKGNPFFMLRPEDYPDAVIIGLGVCSGTTRHSANYAAEAESKGIPTVIYYLSDVRSDKEKWCEAYNIADVPAIEIDGDIPESQQEADSEAKRLIPMFIESLTTF